MRQGQGRARSEVSGATPDSDDDKLEDDNKNPFLTEAQKEKFKKEWAHEKKVKLQRMQHVTRQPIFHTTGVFCDALFSCMFPLVSFSVTCCKFPQWVCLCLPLWISSLKPSSCTLDRRSQALIARRQHDHCTPYCQWRWMIAA
jgi:hypothetical protein